MPNLTTAEQLTMIDEYLEEPNSIDPKWIDLLMQYRKVLMTRGMEERR